MPLRDLAVFLLLGVLVVATLKRPVFGVLGWVLFALLNPHRLCYGPAFDFPFSQVIALTTLFAMLISSEHKQFKGGAPAFLLGVVLVWATINASYGFNPPRAFEYLDRVAKTYLFIWLLLMLMHTRQHVQWLLATMVFSLCYYGVKGGLFVLRSGGVYAVQGPPGSMIEGNNELAIGLVMIIPLLVYFSQQVTHKWHRRGLLIAAGLCTMSVVGSYSRGAMLAITGMGLFLWLRSSRKGMVAVAVLAVAFLAIPFMPDKWTQRMDTINTYEEDASASYRLVAWEAAYNLAMDRFPMGGGFEYETPEVSLLYSPLPDLVMVPHSIYFQTLGGLGFIGLGMLVLFWLLVWRQCAWLRRHCSSPDLKWAHQLASMVQVSLVGYAVGGAFLNLAFWDGAYYFYAAIGATLYVVRRDLAAKAKAAPLAAASNPSASLPPAAANQAR